MLLSTCLLYFISHQSLLLSPSNLPCCTLDKKRRALVIRKKREEAVSAGKAEPDAFQTTQNSRASADSTEPAADSEEKEFSTSTEFTPAIQTEEVKYIQPGERTSEGRCV